LRKERTVFKVVLKPSETELTILLLQDK